MTCANHPLTAAAAACTSCQRPFCRACLGELHGFAICAGCKEYRGPAIPPAPNRQPAGVLEHVIPTRNPAALAAYYCGIFALIPLVGNVLGPAALGLGIVGIRAVARTPGLPGKAHAVTGIVLGCLTSLVYWGLVILALTTLRRS